MRGGLATMRHRSNPGSRLREVSLRGAVRGVPLLASAMAVPALAHVDQGDIGGGLVAGFLHPIFGFDHVVAMVAVGIWGAQLGRPAIWVLPVTFPLVMALGGVL